MHYHDSPPRTTSLPPRRRAGIALWLVAIVAALAVAAPAVTLAATQTMVPACDGVNVRSSASTSATVKARLTTSSTVTVVGTLSGGAWSTTCPTAKSGSGWYKVSAINGRSVSSLYGVSYVYAATGVLKAAPASTTSATDAFGAELMRLVNLDRVALGKPAYLVDGGLANIARDAAFSCPTKPTLQLRGRSRDMADRGYFSHTVPGCYLAGTTTPYSSLTIVRTVFGYTGAQSEIIAWNAYGSSASTYKVGCDINGANCVGGTTTTPYTVALSQRDFMSSSAHRAAELNTYQRFGCGSATVPGTIKTYFTCLFANGGPTPSASPSPSPTPSPTPTPAPVVTPTPAPSPAGTAMVAACAGVNVRTSTSTSATVRTQLTASSTVTVVGTVSGGAWGTSCPTWKSGSSWYRISAINGRSVSSLYGVSSLYAATGVLKAAPVSTTPSPSPTPSPTPTPAPVVTPTPAPSPAGTAMVAACAGVNVRTSTSTSATVRTQLTASSTVTVVGTVSGGAWGTSCPTWKSGSSWYRISAINGRSVSSLYGVSSLYAATGVLKAAPVSTTGATTGSVATLGSTVVFHGRGYGHGVGLSQYGARGRALAGQAAAGILAHYYPGTTPGTIAATTQVRVLVLDDFSATQAVPLTILGRGGEWGIRGQAAPFPADARIRIVPGTAGTTTGWRLTVDDATGKVLLDAAAPADLRLEPRAAGTTLQLLSKPSSDDLYRGMLRLVLASTAADVVNELSIEDYLRGVVPAEMPSSWPVEARTAQTIAARSYAAYRLRPGTSTFDLYDDTRSQVYEGVRRETAEADAVVADTAGKVLLGGGAVANTLFHSTGGGATENNENVFVSSIGARIAGPVSYLRGSADRDAAGVAYDAGAPYATWQTAGYSTDMLSVIFGADARTSVGTLLGLDLHDRGVSGRLISVTLVGSAGTKTVSGSVFTDAFNAGRPATDPPMRSTLLDVAPIP